MAPPIFILSDFRSGSTLLRCVLDTHPSVCSPAELSLAQFCQSALHLVAMTTDEGRQLTEQEHRQRICSVRDMVDRVMDSYCLRKGKDRWCEKSPANTDVLFVLGTVFPDAHYICLHRHGLDQAHSILGVEGFGRLQPYLIRQRGNAEAAAIDRWCRQTERLLAFEHINRRRVRRVIYENFVAAPEDELRGIMEFLGLPCIAGLSRAAFEAKHDDGPGDVIIKSTTAVLRTRAGRGRNLSLGGVGAELRERFAGLLNGLGYPERP
jgi:protein-tyrosine sulfotransferase